MDTGKQSFPENLNQNLQKNLDRSSMKGKLQLKLEQGTPKAKLLETLEPTNKAIKQIKDWLDTSKFSGWLEQQEQSVIKKELGRQYEELSKIANMYEPSTIKVLLETVQVETLKNDYLSVYNTKVEAAKKLQLDLLARQEQMLKRQISEHEGRLAVAYGEEHQIWKQVKKYTRDLESLLKNENDIDSSTQATEILEKIWKIEKDAIKSMDEKWSRFIASAGNDTYGQNNDLSTLDGHENLVNSIFQRKLGLHWKKFDQQQRNNIETLYRRRLEMIDQYFSTAQQNKQDICKEIINMSKVIKSEVVEAACEYALQATKTLSEGNLPSGSSIIISNTDTSFIVQEEAESDIDFENSSIMSDDFRAAFKNAIHTTESRGFRRQSNVSKRQDSGSSEIASYSDTGYKSQEGMESDTSRDFRRHGILPIRRDSNFSTTTSNTDTSSTTQKEMNYITKEDIKERDEILIAQRQQLEEFQTEITNFSTKCNNLQKYYDSAQEQADALYESMIDKKKELDQKDEKIAKLNEDLEQLKEKLNLLQHDHNEYKQVIEGYKDIDKNLNVQKAEFASLQKDYKKANKDYENLQKENISNKNVIKTSALEIKRKENDISNLKKNISELKMKFTREEAQLKKQAEEQKQHIHQIEEDLQNKDQIIAIQASEIAQLKEKMAQLEKSEQQTQNDHNKLNKKYNILQEEFSFMQQAKYACDDFTRKVEKKHDNLNRLQKDLEKKLKIYKGIEQSIEASQSELDEINDYLLKEKTKKIQTPKNLEQERENYRKEHEKYENDIKDINQETQKAQNYSDSSNILADQDISKFEEKVNRSYIFLKQLKNKDKNYAQPKLEEIKFMKSIASYYTTYKDNWTKTSYEEAQMMRDRLIELYKITPEEINAYSRQDKRYQDLQNLNIPINQLTLEKAAEATKKVQGYKTELVTNLQHDIYQNNHELMVLLGKKTDINVFEKFSSLYTKDGVNKQMLNEQMHKTATAIVALQNLKMLLSSKCEHLHRAIANFVKNDAYPTTNKLLKETAEKYLNFIKIQNESRIQKLQDNQTKLTQSLSDLGTQIDNSQENQQAEQGLKLMQRKKELENEIDKNDKRFKTIREEKEDLEQDFEREQKEFKKMKIKQRDFEDVVQKFIRINSDTLSLTETKSTQTDNNSDQ